MGHTSNTGFSYSKALHTRDAAVQIVRESVARIAAALVTSWRCRVCSFVEIRTFMGTPSVVVLACIDVRTLFTFGNSDGSLFHVAHAVNSVERI
jgi:hypothetical protein